MKNILIAESQLEQDLMLAVLPTDFLSKLKIVVAAGETSAISLARSAALQSYDKVLLVLGAYFPSDNTLKEKEAKEIINMVASNALIEVVVISVEHLLLLDKSFLENYFNTSISNLEYELYQRDPQFALEKLTREKENASAKQIARELIANMSDDLRKKILKNEKLQSIIDFFDKTLAY